MTASCLLALIKRQLPFPAKTKTKSSSCILIDDWGWWVLALAAAGGGHQVVERRRVTVDVCCLYLLSKGRDIKDLRLPFCSVTGTEP